MTTTMTMPQGKAILNAQTDLNKLVEQLNEVYKHIFMDMEIKDNNLEAYAARAINATTNFSHALNNTSIPLGATEKD